MTWTVLRPEVEVFAAKRRGALERADEEFEPLVRSGLAGYHGDDQWYRAVRDAAVRLWDAALDQDFPDPSPVADAMREEFVDLLTQALAQTTEPHDPPTDPEVDRLVRWLSTFTINSAAMAAASAQQGDSTLEWVTMHDGQVRASHREADGQVVPVGGTFEVDGYALHHPGEPVGPPSVWINCRCVVRPGREGEFNMTETVVAAADEELVDPQEVAEFTEDEWDSLEFEVPWYGVLAPVNVMSGDRRKFLADTLTYRNLPFPVTWQPAESQGHDGSVVMARADRVWEEDGLIKGEGWLRADSAEGNEVIDLIANKHLRGFSVHLDSAEAEFQNEDGTPFDFDLAPEGTQPVQVITQGRIASVTVVAIPAFQESFIALGTWEDSQVTEVTADAGCSSCEATRLMEEAGAPKRHVEVVARYWDKIAPGGEVKMEDGTEYRFSNGSLQVFAPGTRDGPGWVTNPKETQRLRTYWTRGAGAAKIRWGQPGDFNRCRKQLAKYVKPNFLAGTCANLHKEAIRIWPGEHRASLVADGEAAPAYSLVASADTSIPRTWFDNPNLTDATPLTITDDGRVYGHVATWDTCHLGSNGYCQTAPHSATDYAWFHTGGTVLTDAGPVRVGHLVMGTGHADTRAGLRAASTHYDNSGYSVAKVRVGEDQYGIWFSGVLSPGVTEEQKFNLRASALSGDWRKVGGNLELIAALVVNVPGFPIHPTAIGVDNKEQVALVASGIVLPEQGAIDTKPIQVEFDPGQFAAAIRDAVEQIEAAKQRKHDAAGIIARLRVVEMERIRQVLDQ